MAHLQIESTFRRSNQLEQLIETQFQKLQRFGEQIQTAKVFLKKEQKAHFSDIVTINLAVKGQRGITVTIKDTLFEKSIKNAFKVIKRQLRK